MHDAAGFVAEHRRHAKRWDLAAIARELDGNVAFYIGGSAEDPYEHRQIQAARERVPEAQILTFPGGHLTTSEHPDLLATAIRDIAERHGIPSPACRYTELCRGLPATGREPGEDTHAGRAAAVWFMLAAAAVTVRDADSADIAGAR
jgi:hypothetical protein